MIERVVENWLISANERQYQIPFCQLLASEGETILYISRHGQLEQGKDVVTRAPDGKIRGYQLKGGSLALSDWQNYKGEIDELVIYPVEYPSRRSRKTHDPFLVTNSTVSDAVLNRIETANKVWKKQGANPLTLIAGPELVSRFVKAHGKFLPRDPKDFVRFLELIVDTGQAPLDKPKFAALLEAILPIDFDGKKATLEVQRSAASAVLLATYILQGAEKVANHWAIFEAWTMVTASIAMVAEKHKISLTHCDTSLKLCLEAATRALFALTEECSKNTVKFTQGDPFTDGEFYRSRITILCGLLGSASLAQRIEKQNWKYVDFVHNFLINYIPRVRLWGESAVPYLLLAALECEQHGHHAIAEGLVLQLIDSIARINGTKGRGLPSPYYDAEASVRLANGLERFNAEVFTGTAYTLETLIQFLARRWNRRHIASQWERITQVDFARFDVGESWEYFRWKSTGGKLVTVSPPAPQSWAKLLAESEAAPQCEYAIFRQFPHFALFFATVYPHRFTSDLLKTIERAL